MNKSLLTPKVESLCVLLFLVPIFFCFINVEQLGVHSLTYFQFLLFPLLIFIMGYKASFLFFSTFIIVLIFNFLLESCSNLVELLFESFKFALYFSVPIVVALKVKVDLFYNYTVKLMKWSLTIVAISFLLRSLLGFSVFINHGYLQDRYHALFTEPSAMAIPLSVLIYDAFKSKNYKWIVFSLFAMFLIKSLIVFSVFLITVSFFLMVRFFGFRAVSFATLFIIFLSTSFITVESISFIEGYNERLYSGLVSILTLGENGYNPRMITTMSVINMLLDKGQLVLGFGFGVGECHTQYLEWKYDSNILMYFLFSSGLIGLFLYLSIILTAFVMINVKSKYVFSKEFALFIISFFGVLINGAQGMLFISFHIAAIIFIYKKTIFKRFEND
ncbi:MAG: hypothetical protein VYB81_05285 [Pseudomonadota bacterium]|nr:hypothetical protein [Pseudomonadota bacterium]